MRATMALPPLVERIAASLAPAALLVAALLAGVATDASAQGSISGRVTSSTTGNGLVNTVVEVYDLNSNFDIPATATTDGMGFYTANLPAGDYAVLTQNRDGYINEIWDNISCSATCDANSLTAITITNAPVANINFVLDPGGRISGTVTSSVTGLPIAGVRVIFFDSAPNTYFTSGVTDATGQYITDGGTAAGNAYACTMNSVGYQDEAYGNVKSPDCDPSDGILIPVTAAGATGINFALDPGGQITGTVTDVNGAPLMNVEVHVTNGTGAGFGNAVTDASGHYATGGLPAGTYYVNTRNALGLADRLYDGQFCAGGRCNPPFNGTPISLMISSVITGIDFVLPPGGQITGTVTNAVGGAPLPNIFVAINDAFGNFVGGDNTNASGVYTTGAVPAGIYYANIVNTPGFLNQMYNNLPCAAFCPGTAGTPIAVAVNATTGGINFVLTPTASSGAISGTVTSAASGLPVAAFQVQVLLASNGANVASINTDAAGLYTVTGLAPGSYYVRTNGSSNLINQLHSGVTCVGCAVTTSGGTPVVVAAGATTGSINFSLATGGRISGIVTNAAGGALLQGVGAQVFNTAGVQMGNFNTNASGVYTTQGLPPGTYYVRTSNALGFVNKLYTNSLCPGNGCNVLTGTPITATASTTTSGINFALDAGGRISGTVTNATSTLPLQNVNVQIFNAVGVSLGNAPATDASGNYTSFGLPAGTYYVRTGNGIGLVDELYNNITCLANFSCPATSGTPVTVTGVATTTGVNFALSPGGAIYGRATDANTTLPLASVQVQVYDSSGVLAKTAGTSASGNYVVGGLPPGTYYVRTAVSGTTFYEDELYNEKPCFPTCTLTSGDPIVVSVASVSVTGVDFTLTPGGGAIAGTVTDAVTGVPIPGVTVQIYTSAGVLTKLTGGSTANGTFAVSGLPAGTYYARTAVSNGLNYADELYANKPWPCVPSCAVSTGTPITVVAGATQSGVDFSLVPNLVQNGQFLNGTGNWLLFATPDSTYMVSNVTSGVFQFARNAPPPGTSNQAVVFQQTGVAVGANAPLLTQFDFGNTDTIRKRISVLVHDSDFSDLSVCTFWLPASAPIRTYAMRTHTTKAWTNATISFYAASAGTGGFYQLDNVLVRSEPAASATETMCVDPTVPVPPGGVDGPTLLVNGDFTSGAVAPGWSLFGQISGSVTSGVFQFIKLAGTPAGVLLQPTTQVMTANQLLTASFQLGNSSAVRKRVTVILHDNNFSDLSACTFWLAPGQPLSNYTYRTFATQAWANATLSVYPATTGPEQWIRLDNVSLKRTPSAAITGTECLEPGSSPDAPAAWTSSTATGPNGGQASRPGLLADPDAPTSVGTADQNGAPASRPGSDEDGWIGDGFKRTGEPSPAGTGPSWVAVATEPGAPTLTRAEPLELASATSATFRFASWLTAIDSRATVEVSLDGVTWETVHRVEASDTWVTVDVRLDDYAGARLFVRFAFRGAQPSAESPDVWRVDPALR